MILVDQRVGSRELLPVFLRLGADAIMSGELSADFMWSGNGPDGSVLCGVERKVITEALDSMRNHRLEGQQARPMMETCAVRYLVIEGVWRRNPETDMIEVVKGRTRENRTVWTSPHNIRYAEFVKFLASMRERGGYIPWRTLSADETAAYVVDEWSWWQKPWDEHKTGTHLYIPEFTSRRGSKPSMFRSKATVTERWLHALPHLDNRVTELARMFARPRDIVTAGEYFWSSIKGIGKKTARDIERAIDGV